MKGCDEHWLRSRGHLCGEDSLASKTEQKGRQEASERDNDTRTRLVFGRTVHGSHECRSGDGWMGQYDGAAVPSVVLFLDHIDWTVIGHDDEAGLLLAGYGESGEATLHASVVVFKATPAVVVVFSGVRDRCGSHRVDYVCIRPSTVVHDRRWRGIHVGPRVLCGIFCGTHQELCALANQIEQSSAK